ncbi:copper-binding protein [Thiobacillus thioparus]|uniref:copper-binding protein n=1 Tax=Thiobacillus thioparus TaxID=931 RepID=UPI000B49681E|nr:copper-binding protein [Thiobacillus thioparus]MBS0329948.1 copper-binding protein [Pseudomonadota bacterium]
MNALVTSTMVALIAGTPALAADMGDMKMNAPSGMQGDSKHQAVQGTGVVKAIDPVKGSITIAHQAIPALKWPAMTMSFKIDKPLASTVKPGQHVAFELVANGMGGTITRITVLK